METRRRFAAGRRIGRDTVLLVFGLAGIGYQQITGEIHGELLIMFGAMVGVPGVAALTELLPSRRRGPEDEATTSSSSPSPPSSSLPSSPPT